MNELMSEKQKYSVVFFSTHRLELQVVSGRILEEHGVLFSRLSLESQMWFDYKFDAILFQSISQ